MLRRARMFSVVWHLASRAQGVAALVDDLGGERYVAGNNEIAGAHPFDDLVIGYVESARYLHRPNVGQIRRVQRLFATSVIEMPVRFAARNRISLIAAGHASASIQIAATAVLPKRAVHAASSASSSKAQKDVIQRPSVGAQVDARQLAFPDIDQMDGAVNLRVTGSRDGEKSDVVTVRRPNGETILVGA